MERGRRYMVVASEFIDIFVPVRIIERKYPGGWAGFLQHAADSIGSKAWHDGNLYREGAASPNELEKRLAFWRDHGLTTHAENADGSPSIWIDVCVAIFGSATLPCDWLLWSSHPPGAYLRGTEPGILVSREMA